MATKRAASARPWGKTGPGFIIERNRGLDAVNYRHIFHAGNFADVFKHALLLELIAALTAKPKPLAFLDTHAGAGCYVLSGTDAERTGEFRQGVLRLIEQKAPPAPLAAYLDLVRACNAQARPGELSRYPGSPWLAASALRANDRLVLCEIQESEYYQLSALFEQDPRVRVYRRDGYAALKALLPPKERRGLILIDAPFEGQEQEYRRIEAALGEALERFPTGVYAVWYPIKLRQHVRPFHRWLAACGAKSVLALELLLHPDDSALRLNGCGLAIVNPPWRIERKLEPILDALQELLQQGRHGTTQVIWLAGPD